ncbi:polygalacturonase-like [Wolffia australiana]
MARPNGVLPLLLVFAFCLSSSADTVYDVVSLGASPLGQTDSAEAVRKAWTAACDSSTPTIIRVPTGRFFISSVEMQGPCKNVSVTFQIEGTLVAPTTYADNDDWIKFDHVDGVSLMGGTIDGQGEALWDCKSKGLSCPLGSRSLVFLNSRNVIISGLTSVNSKFFHIAIDASESVLVQNVKISAPVYSHNTDGIHVQGSRDVKIIKAQIGTGDDCISIGPGTSNLWVEQVSCGPGHGISIGSLGNDLQEEGVQNVTVTMTVFNGTQNGLRIKTWGGASDGFVKGVVFEHATMLNVENPIIITQSYCPNRRRCSDQNSGVKITEVTYNDIKGSSATPVAVQFRCSPSSPCSGIGLENIKLTYENFPANAYCQNAYGSASGFVIPPSCL